MCRRCSQRYREAQLCLQLLKQKQMAEQQLAEEKEQQTGQQQQKHQQHAKDCDLDGDQTMRDGVGGVRGVGASYHTAAVLRGIHVRDVTTARRRPPTSCGTPRGWGDAAGECGLGGPALRQGV